MNIKTNLAIKENINTTTSNTNNIVGYNNPEASTQILNYLEDRKRKSKSTYTNYLRYYKEFFMFACNKQINELIWNDIFEVDYSKVCEFKKFLLNKGDSPNYTNQKMFSLKKLWEKLYYINHDVDIKVFEFEEEEFEENNYASLNDKEMELLFQFAESGKWKRPLTRRIYFEFLYIVGCRENAAANLKWSDIKQIQDNKTGNKIWVAIFKDKSRGKMVKKAINDDFYTKLLKLKETESLDKKIFDLNIDTLIDTFNKFREKYNLFEKDGQKVCIHSIKKSSGWLVQNTFNDLNKTRKHCQHKSPTTTAKIYIDVEDYSDQASYLLGKDINIDLFKNLNKEELLELIEKCGKTVQMKMYYQMIKNNK